MVINLDFERSFRLKIFGEAYVAKLTKLTFMFGVPGHLRGDIKPQPRLTLESILAC